MRSLTRTTAIAAVLFTACDLPPGDMTDPHYWGQVFLDKYADERAYAVTHIEEGPVPLAEPRPVLLITGVTIPAEWFDPIKLRLERDGFMPFVWEPPDLLSGDLLENAERLADVVDQIRAETGFERIDILAECTGGVIARYYIQSMGGDQYIKRMVTFISPQHGVDKAPLAAGIAGWPALYDLSPGSDFLDAVNSAPLPDNVRFTSIYTCTDEYIQPYQTSIIPGAHNIGLCEGFVGHYQFFYDPAIYMIMHGALTEAIDGDEGAPADPGDPGDPGTPGDDPSDPSDPNDPGSPVPDDMGGCSASSGGASGGATGLVLLGAAVVVSRRRRCRSA